MSKYDHSDFSEKRTFMGRFGFAIGGLVLVGIVVAVFSQMFSGPKGPPPRKQQEMVMIKPPPPPPPTPPPPPPPPQDAPKQEMIQQDQVNEEDTKPVEAPSDPSPNLGTGLVGNGPPDGFGLNGNKGGFMGNGSNSGRVNRSQFGWYANQLIQSFSEALSKNAHTQNAGFNIEVKIWADAVGRVIRAKLVESTGDAPLDEVIKNQILIGFQLKEPPPDGMPMPIVMRLKARRPN